MDADNFPTIRINDLLLRQFVDSDLPNVFRGLSSPEVVKWYGVSYQTMEEAKEQLKFFKDLTNEGTGIWWAICSSDNSEFFGAGGLNDLCKIHRKAELGFWLFPENRNRGIMTEIEPVICNYGFEKLGLHRIEGYVESENTACKRALEKLQFNFEGTKVDCEIKDGKFISLDIYAKLAL